MGTVFRAVPGNFCLETTMAETKRYNLNKLERLKWGRRFIILVLALFLLFRLVIGISAVSGVSMNDTLYDGDIVLYTRLGEAEKGELVSVRVPGGDYYVKRVVAVGGDVVDIKGGVLYVNGVAETGEYVKGETKPEDVVISYPYTVPEGYVFALGDNREESVDSRSFGAVKQSEIKGILKLLISKRGIKAL